MTRYLNWRKKWFELRWCNGNETHFFPELILYVLDWLTPKYILDLVHPRLGFIKDHVKTSVCQIKHFWGRVLGLGVAYFAQKIWIVSVAHQGSLCIYLSNFRRAFKSSFGFLWRILNVRMTILSKTQVLDLTVFLSFVIVANNYFISIT